MQAVAEKILAPSHSSFHLWKRKARQYPFYWHYHPEYELTLILKGHGRRFVGDHIASYKPGDLVLVGPNLPHSWASDSKSIGGQEALVLQFNAEFLGPEFLKAPELKDVSRLLKRAVVGLGFNSPPQERFKALSRLKGLEQLLALIELLSWLSLKPSIALSSPGSSGRFKNEKRLRIDKICAYMFENFKAELPLSKAASLSHMSESAFSRYFTKRCGKTFIAYLSELRIGYACKLLLEGEQPVSEICFESGFQNLSNFNRQFLRLKKMSPQAFRASFDK